MKRHLSRKHFLSLGVYGGLGLIAYALHARRHAETTGAAGQGGSSSSGPTGPTTTSSSGAAGSTTSAAGGNGGSGTTQTTTGTAGSGGAGGAPTSGSGGKGGNGGNGGTGGTGGSGGSGGKGGAGGSAGSGGKGGSGGTGGVERRGRKRRRRLVHGNAHRQHLHEPHGNEHVLQIPAADIVAGVAKVYATSGATANHMHYVQLTAADFTTLQTGGVVTKHSCNGGDRRIRNQMRHASRRR